MATEWWRPRGETNGNSRLTWSAVEEIRASKLPYRTLASKYGVCKATIWQVVTFQTWKVRDDELVAGAAALVAVQNGLVSR